jgi:hypothetical protein
LYSKKIIKLNCLWERDFRHPICIFGESGACRIKEIGCKF